MAPATVKRLAAIDTVVGVKEAHGNISQMASIAALVPEHFAILSGDDAITLPLFALGGRGVVSGASNEIPWEMPNLCNFPLQNHFPAAPQIPMRHLPLPQANLLASNTTPLKAATA